MTAIQASPDAAQVEAFVGKVLTDSSASLVTTLAMIGDRLGLWQSLAEGPATSVELAARACIDERYCREWLCAMTAHSYLQHDPRSGRFTLPPEHAPALADEGGPMFFGGGPPGDARASHGDRTAHRGVPAWRRCARLRLRPNFWEGTTRFTANWFDNLLLPTWIPAMPEVEAALERGADVADIGCGQGRAIVKLAQAFPAGRYVGYDLHEQNVDAARAHATASRVDDRVRFELRDVSTGLSATYDVITSFDVVHDAVDPRGMLRSIHGALRPGGRYVCLDINASHRLADNIGPLGAMFYGFSVLYCMTVSLAQHGAGLGTCGFNAHTVSELCTPVGFSVVRKVPLDNPFNNLYEISP